MQFICQTYNLFVKLTIYLSNLQFNYKIIINQTYNLIIKLLEIKIIATIQPVHVHYKMRIAIHGSTQGGEGIYYFEKKIYYNNKLYLFYIIPKLKNRIILFFGVSLVIC